MNLTVVAVSKNTNSFGLYSIICLARNGRGWNLLKSGNLPKAGEDLDVKIEDGELVFPRFHSYECPRELPQISQTQATKLINSIKRLASIKG